MVLIVDPFCYVCLMLFSVMLLSVPCCLVLTCLEKIDIMALLCVVLSCIYVTFLLWSFLKNAFGESMETGIAKIGHLSGLLSKILTKKIITFTMVLRIELLC